MSRFIRLFMIAMLLTAGCAVKVPPVATYVLTVPPTATAVVHPRTQHVLLVNTMTANPGYKSNRMIYVTSPAYLRPYASHEWVAPPAQMLMPLIVARIEAKQVFRAVVTPPFINTSDYRLDTRLVVLQQEFMQPVSQVRCEVQALLTNNRTDHVIASRRFQVIVAAPGNNPASGVAAANQAADQISEQIAQFVVANTQ